MEAVGWALNNRVGAPTFPKTLTEAINANGAFDGRNNNQWALAADPSKLTGTNVPAYKRSQDVANGILRGEIKDPIGGAQFFYSGPTPPREFFQPRLASGRLAKVPGGTYGNITIVRDTQN